MTAAATPATLADLKGTFVLDASHSQLGFVARHAMVTKVRGSFTDVTGTASVDGANPSASSAKPPQSAIGTSRLRELLCA